MPRIEADIAWVAEGEFCEPETVISLPNGDLLVSNVCDFRQQGNGFLTLLSSGGEALDWRVVDGLDAPLGMAMLGNRLYVIDNNRLKIFDWPAYKLQETIDLDTSVANDLAVASNGTVYITDTAKHKVIRLQTDGTQSILTGEAQFMGANGIAIEGNKLYVGGERVWRLGLDGSEVETLGPEWLTDIDGIEFEPDGTMQITPVAGPLVRYIGEDDIEIIEGPGISSANHGYSAGLNLALIPTGYDNTVIAIRVAAVSEPPNILWLVAEDLSPIIKPFGDSTANTPNLNRLADEGVRYPSLFSTHGVCAPSRAAIITGMYPSGIGANHMRTNSNMDFTGLPAYEAVPPPEVRMFTEFLREAGYYTSNNAKEDYQFAPPVTGWDESSEFAHWRNRAEGQPFFSVFNFNITHESSLFEPYGFKIDEERHFESGNRDFELAGWNVRIPESETPNLVPKDADFPIPPYLPDSEISRRDIWKTYNNLARMDQQIGAILDQLEEDGLLDNTIIFFYADHGGPLPRQKRLIYDSGLNSPMIIRFPDQQNADTTDDQLISFVDFAPTVLSIAGIEPPRYMQGHAFLGSYKAANERKYVHAATDRLDEYTDARRAVRDQQFKYIRNYRPEQGYYLPVSYREQIPTMQELLELRDDGRLDEVQSQWFRKEKPRQELFDLDDDPHELHNLVEDQEYSEKVLELSQEMDRWLGEIGDNPNLSERELIAKLWQGAGVQPRTANPVVTFSDGDSLVTITSETGGASIGYQVIVDGVEPSSWKIYIGEPVEVAPNTTLRVQAQRIGYLRSETIEFSWPGKLLGPE